MLKMKKIKVIVFTCVLYFFVYGVQLVLVHKFVNPIVTPLMICRVIEGAVHGDFHVGIHKEWKDLDEISPNMIRAVFLAEDQNFTEHNGFNWDNIKRAIEYNKKHKGKKIRGGSTISQQTAKNVFLPPSRTWIRKGVEAYFTVLIELFWSKQRILEVYLNVIETGKGTYGVEAAAHKYYRTSAAKLTNKQAISIAAILPLPLKWSPVKPNKRVAEKIAKISAQVPVYEMPAEFK